MRNPLLLGLVGAQMFAQAPDSPPWQTAAGGKMAFEVAAVKPSVGTFTPPNFPLDAGDAYATTGGRFSADFPLSVYITFAYKLTLTPEQRQSMLAHLPKWVASDRFSIQAKADGNPTKDQMRLMMQSLLAERFKLEVHFETQRVPLLALTLIKPGKTGPKLRPHAEGPACDASAEALMKADVFPTRCDVYAMTMMPNKPVRAGSRNTTIDLLASALPGLGRLARPVVDQTGLSGRFDFMIEWTPESNTPPAEDAIQGTTFLEALHEQLGLKLEATNGPLQVLIVDRVERPSEN
jgi:bla regulator protein blaR1